MTLTTRRCAAALTAVAISAAAGKAYADDPFAGLAPLDDDALADARGGFIIAGDHVEIAGMLVEFAFAAANLSVGYGDTAISLDDFNVTPTQVLEFDQAYSTVVLNNTMNDVTISQSRAFEIYLPSYDAALDAAQTATAVEDAIQNAVLLGNGRP